MIKKRKIKPVSKPDLRGMDAEKKRLSVLRDKRESLFEKLRKVDAEIRRIEQLPEADSGGQLSFDEVLEKDLKVMDGASVALCRDGNLPIQVFEFGKVEDLLKAVKGEVGTRVMSE